MNKKFFQCAAFVLTAALTAVPALSQAATAQSTAAVHATYKTTFSRIPGPSAPWTGSLQLTIHSDGIIQGYYRPDGDQGFIPVTGGRDGDNVWLEIGRDGGFHVDGTLHNGVITGAAMDEATGTQYDFTARA